MLKTTKIGNGFYQISAGSYGFASIRRYKGKKTWDIEVRWGDGTLRHKCSGLFRTKRDAVARVIEIFETGSL